MLRPSFTTLMALAASACGAASQTPAEKPTHQAHAQVQSWDKSADYAARKKIIYDTVKAAGKGDDIAATIQAMAMIETDLLLASQRDTSKDQSGLAKNYSLYNFNEDYLIQVGYDKSKFAALNSDNSVDEATRVALMGIDKYGLDNFQNFHRGGSQGLADGFSFGCGSYRSGIAATQQLILSTPNAFWDQKRYATFIDHV